jgi:hypothetical protein
MVNEISDFASLEHLFLSGDRSGIVGVNRRIDQISDIAMDLINKKIYEAADSLSDVSEDLEGDDFLNPEMVREALSCIIEDSEEVELLTKVLLIHENDINIEEIKDVLSKVKQMPDGLASYWILSSIFEMVLDSSYDANNAEIELLNLLCDEFGERIHFGVEEALQVLRIYIANNDDARAMRILHIISDTATESVSEKKAL